MAEDLGSNLVLFTIFWLSSVIYWPDTGRVGAERFRGARSASTKGVDLRGNNLLYCVR